MFGALDNDLKRLNTRRNLESCKELQQRLI